MHNHNLNFAHDLRILSFIGLSSFIWMHTHIHELQLFKFDWHVGDILFRNVSMFLLLRFTVPWIVWHQDCDDQSKIVGLVCKSMFHVLCKLSKKSIMGEVRGQGLAEFSRYRTKCKWLRYSATIRLMLVPLLPWVVVGILHHVRKCSLSITYGVGCPSYIIEESE